MHQSTNQSAGFPRKIAAALTKLKQQLERDYEQAYPELRKIIHLVLEQEEARARDLTVFPHLLLPDLVEARVAQLNLRPVETKRAHAVATQKQDQLENDQLVFALCA